jgi:hypothetical protein
LIYPLLTVLFTSCLFTKGHFSSDGSMWIWNKDPNGSYNADNPLLQEKSDQWVQKIRPLKQIRTMKIEVFSNDWDDYEVNDTGVFIKNGNLNKGAEMLKYKRAATMGKQLGMPDTMLISLIKKFDQLKLNRFYRENEFLAFETQVYFDLRRGYFYFYDPTFTDHIRDTFDLKYFGVLNNFKYGGNARFALIKKYDEHWVKWELK